MQLGDPTYGTRLAPDQEKKYQEWKAKLPKNLQYEGDYDLRGLWKENQNVKPSANLHFPDKYKLPNHPTFSDESIYFNDKTKGRAGRWKETDSSWEYIPYDPKIKKRVVEMKDDKSVKTDKDQSVKDWFRSYVASPKYKERLAGFYKYPDYVQRKRLERADALGITEEGGDILKYDTDTNSVRVSPVGLLNAPATREEAFAHEYGHALNSPDNPSGVTLSPREEAFIFDRNTLDPSLKQGAKASALRQGLGVSYYLKSSPSLHDLKPSESHSDINAFRYLLNRRGIYDAGNQDITPDILQRAAKDPVIRKSFIYKRIKENFDDKGLLEIMNKVAMNNNNKSNIA